ncbi:beta-1,6-N-acetylglucosaminyltransferase [Salegentibacter salarius]|uniref:beta-1,6-N-acetylglucosaminyltransferase n=1 Tax=Salegentibacter salarius TaxID=435906 RepID=UPI0009D4D32D|nr:beta-1,6-N-acetylglucosaminyltransferase [Salegentibacter salarius]SLJ98090.1 Core-2/I-Branching enzyme [Salegentibacter salarius]
MVINYLILAHKNPEQLYRLITRLDSNNVNFFIHIDKAVDISTFSTGLSGLSNVYFLKDKYRLITPWSDINGCKVLITLLRMVYEKVKTNAYCIFLSGQDYPLKDNIYIYNYLKTHYGKNFISLNQITNIWPEWRTRLERYNFHFPNNQRVFKGIFPLADKRCFTTGNLKNSFYIAKRLGLAKVLQTFFKPKRFHPSHIEPVGGSAFWALPIETVDELLVYINKHPEFLDYHEYTHVPDEILFHSIVNLLKQPHEIAESTTYTNWERKREDDSGPVMFQTQEDLEELLALDDHYLFARKFDTGLGSFILDELDKKTNFQSQS